MTETAERNRAVAAQRGGAATDDVRSERRRTSRHRLVIELSPDLHRRILTICATRRVPVNQAVREMLDRSFPG